jgi:uncharacterized protein YjbI with pentapeptide repeats
MKPPALAPVAPRVLSPVTGEALPLEHEVRAALAESRWRSICLVGGAGAGKTTALSHLAAALGQPLVYVLANEGAKEDRILRLDDVTIHAAAQPVRDENQLVLRLAPWGDDEVLEYLLAVHPHACASVMLRLRQAGDGRLAQGNPELWRTALDRLVVSEAVAGVRAALRYEIGALLLDDANWKLAGERCLAELIDETEPAQRKHVRIDDEHWRWLASALLSHVHDSLDPPEAERVTRLLRHPTVRHILAADVIRNGLIDDERHPFLAFPLPSSLIEAAGPLIASDSACTERLKQHLEGPDKSVHAMAASLLFAAHEDWRPTRAGAELAHGYFPRAKWSDAVLALANLTAVDLSGADLTGAALNDSIMPHANLRQAVLRSAKLWKVDAREADFQSADMTNADASGSDFRHAQMRGVRADGASFTKAKFSSADLSMGRFHRADFREAILDCDSLDDADFSSANFDGASLSDLDLSRTTSLAGATFARANLRRTSLEGLNLPKADFREADLTEALFTGTTIRDADFRGACLVFAGLADVDWEDADLRWADLRGCSFHLGSTRCGLVGSPIACEGSRTGFYTDDYNDQQFKRPEEIRKANLRRADLRGANLQGVDFYLVDLRGAKIDPIHKAGLRRSGAILADPA